MFNIKVHCLFVLIAGVVAGSMMDGLDADGEWRDDDGLKSGSATGRQTFTIFTIALTSNIYRISYNRLIHM